jgi:hypothetical protein
MSKTPRTDAITTAIIYFDVDHAKLANFARELERENAALREDKERLDWLAVQHRRERQSFSEDASKDESVMVTVFHADGTFTVVQGPTFRAAIDAARKEAQP